MAQRTQRQGKRVMLNVTLAHTALYLLCAVACGACIGFERQWRQRLAGLRTNTLVALGAASFVVFASLVRLSVAP